jgi:uncharacterized protein YlxW (UPF0749 family)
MAIVIQVRTVTSSNKVVSQSLVNNDLRDQVLKWKEKYDVAYQELQNSQKKLEEARQSASSNTAGSEEKEEQIKNNNMLIGLTDVQGEGIIITLKDNTNVTADSLSITDDVSYYLVHDGDLISIVNELKNAGAEAISINDQRIVSTTSITCQGNVISVNNEKVSSPFVIKAIGSSSYMNSALTRPGGLMASLSSYLITSVKQSNNVEISKYTGVISSKYMKYQD